MHINLVHTPKKKQRWKPKKHFKNFQPGLNLNGCKCVAITNPQRPIFFVAAKQ